jgi:hypothetical protein
MKLEHHKSFSIKDLAQDDLYPANAQNLEKKEYLKCPEFYMSTVPPMAPGLPIRK